MKTAFIIISLLLLSAQVPFAQSRGPSGYLVLNSGDTLYGIVNHVDHRGVRPKFYKQIRLTNSRGKKKKYKWNDVAAFRAYDISYEGFWLYKSTQRIINPNYDIDPQNGEKYFSKSHKQRKP